MNKWRAGFIVFLAVTFGLIAYSLYKEHKNFRSNVEKLRADSADLENENKSLTKKIEYFRLPENLLKEARTRFNFTKQGEKLLIVIPGEETTSTEP